MYFILLWLCCTYHWLSSCIFMYSTCLTMCVLWLIVLVDSICRKSKENESTRLVYSTYNSLRHWQGVNLHSHQVFMCIYGRINNFTWTEGSIELIFLELVWKLFTFLKKKNCRNYCQSCSTKFCTKYIPVCMKGTQVC